MADPRRTETRRAGLSYDQLKKLTKESGAQWPNLLIKDYSGILQDFAFTSDELDDLDVRITINELNIVILDERVDDLDVRVEDLQGSHYPNLISQVQFLQRQASGLPEFTIDTTGFTTDLTFITTDKVIA